MYERFYGLSELPFSQQREPDSLYFSESHRRVFDNLEQVILRHFPVSVLSGDDGVGKTTLIRALLKRLDDRVVVGLINNSGFFSDSLTQRVAVALGLDIRGRENDVLQLLSVFMARIKREARQALLVVDEAHNLTCAALQELAELPGLDADGPLQLLLLGQSELQREMKQTEIPLFAGDAVQYFELPEFNQIETDAYIRHRVNCAGRSEVLFTPSASEAIHQYTCGVPAMINRICELVLAYGAAHRLDHIDETVVAQVLQNRSGRRLHKHAGGQQMVVDAARRFRSGPVEPMSAHTPTSGASQGENVHILRRERASRESTRSTSSVQSRVGPAPRAAANDLPREHRILKLSGAEQGSEPDSLPDDHRDMVDFIRMSLQQQRLQNERLTLRILLFVALLAVVMLWAVIELRSMDGAPPKVASSTAEDRRPVTAPPASAGALEQSPQPVSMHPSDASGHSPLRSEGKPQPSQALAVQMPAASYQSAPVMPEPSDDSAVPVETTNDAAASGISADTQSLHKELEEMRRKLESEQRRMQRKIETQRAEHARLREEAEREREHAEKARKLLEEAKERSRRAWQNFQNAPPEAYSEDETLETPKAIEDSKAESRTPDIPPPEILSTVPEPLGAAPSDGDSALPAPQQVTSSVLPSQAVTHNKK